MRSTRESHLAHHRDFQSDDDPIHHYGEAAGGMISLSPWRGKLRGNALFVIRRAVLRLIAALINMVERRRRRCACQTHPEDSQPRQHRNAALILYGGLPREG